VKSLHPRKLAEVVMLWSCTVEVSVTNLVQDTGYLHGNFYGFRPSLQEKIEMLLSNRLRLT